MLRHLLQTIGFLGTAFLAVMAVAILSDMHRMQDVAFVRPSEVQTSADAPPADAELVETEVATESAVKTAPKQAESQPAAAAQSQETQETTGTEVRRVSNPYPFPVKSEAELYALGRAAIVNIYCQSKGSLSSISGSGVVIDPRGVILTNAHVAQYMLLATESRMNMECFIRTGSPSQNRYKADILFLPSAWIAEHAEDIIAKRPKGTGEHDYALLVISNTLDGTPLPTSFPHLPVDTREAIAFTSDRVLLAGYPAEFAIKSTGGSSILYPASVFTKIGDLMTFGERSVDLVALGGAVLAQSGSSGGAAINLWGQLVGIISTTSDGSTTAERELRAITLAYIDRDLAAQSGSSLDSFLSGDIHAKASVFMRNHVSNLAQTLIGHLK
jgi:S1-C subfamily serine protease